MTTSRATCALHGRLIIILLSIWILLSVGWSSAVGAAACSSPGRFILLTTQAEVDALGATGCDSIPKGLIIEGADISDVDALINITGVGGVDFGLIN